MNLYSFKLNPSPAEEKNPLRADITVVVASYKYGHLAAHCIESILSQSIKPARIIFIDDGAGDCTHLTEIYPEVEFIIREKKSRRYRQFSGCTGENWVRIHDVCRRRQLASLRQHRASLKRDHRYCHLRYHCYRRSKKRDSLTPSKGSAKIKWRFLLDPQRRASWFDAVPHDAWQENWL